MRIRSFVIAYALVLALLLFADRRPISTQPGRYSHVVDLTATNLNDLQNTKSLHADGRTVSGTRMISPAALIPGTWSAGQIPAERLVAPLVVLNLKGSSKITLDDIDGWESKNGMIPQGAIVAIRRDRNALDAAGQMPITSGAAQFLMDARYVLGFAIETNADLTSDRPLARQLALHGDYVVESATGMTSLPEAGSLVIIAPAKSKNAPEAAVRVLAMVR